MFSTSTAKRVAREAEKIVSLKEDMDTVSWTRVLEIGNQLQENVDEAERVSLRASSCPSPNPTARCTRAWASIRNPRPRA